MISDHQSGGSLMKWLAYSLLFCICITLFGIGLILVFLGQSIINPREAAAIGTNAIYCGYALIAFGIIEFVFSLIVLFSKKKTAESERDVAK
jgi:multisubunit Na+/H+ antiporter MnhG subunit